jgi:hypothetical protein
MSNTAFDLRTSAASALTVALCASASADWIPATVFPIAPQSQGCAGAAIAAAQAPTSTASSFGAVTGTIWMGAPFASANARQSGVIEAWTFDSVTLEWQFNGMFASSQPQAGGGFGATIAHSGSVLVAGSPRARGAVSQAPLGRECGGKAEVFGNVTYLNPVGILGTQLVPTPETRGGDQFGSAVAVRPASDGSGSRVFVSSPGADNGTAADSGRVHSFRFVTDVGWQQAMAFTMPKPAASDKLGAAIATDGDRVFASIDRNGGAVAVFGAAGAEPLYEGTLPAPVVAGAPAMGFGRAMDHDGAFLVVGAPGAYGQPADEGTVFVLDAAPPHAVRTVITSPFEGECLGFGAAVSLRLGTLVVGTSSAADEARDGKVAVYDFNHDTGEVTIRSMHAGEAETSFGSVVVTTGWHVAMGAPTAGAALSGKVRTESVRVGPRSPDLNGDGVVSGADVGILVGMFRGLVENSPGDLNFDLSVDGADLAILLGAWGPVP